MTIHVNPDQFRDCRMMCKLAKNKIGKPELICHKYFNPQYLTITHAAALEADPSCSGQGNANRSQKPLDLGRESA